MGERRLDGYFVMKGGDHRTEQTREIGRNGFVSLVVRQPDGDCWTYDLELQGNDVIAALRQPGKERVMILRDGFTVTEEGYPEIKTRTMRDLAGGAHGD